MSEVLRETITDGLMEKLKGYQDRSQAAKLSGVIEQMVVHCEQTGFLRGLEAVEGTSEGTVFENEEEGCK